MASQRLSSVTMLVVIATLVGCGNEPGTAPQADAGSTNSETGMVDTDRPLPSPDVLPDAGPSLLVDVVDAAVVPNDTPIVADTGTSPTDAAAAFDPAICAAFEANLWQVEGTTRSGSIGCEMTSDGARIWIDTLAGTLGIGYTDGECSANTCRLPTGGASDGCTWNNMRASMRNFTATRNGRTVTVNAIPRSGQ